jgi:transposase
MSYRAPAFFPEETMTLLKLGARQRSDLEYLVSHSPLTQERCRARVLLRLDEGEPVEAIAESLRVSRQTIYNRVRQFQERSGLDLRERLADAPRPGRPRTDSGAVDPLIAQVIATDPRELGDHSTVWTAPLLKQYLRDHHEIEISRKTVSRAIARLEIRWKRPRHELALRPEHWRQSKGGSNAG